VRTEGQVYKISLFPELFEVIGSQYGGDGTSTFAVPRIEEYDYLANDRFGAITLYRCIATRKLRDNLPAATLGWCKPLK
jgi:microcystin-dependent protein